MWGEEIQLSDEDFWGEWRMATLIARYSTGGHCMWVLLVFGVWNEPRKLARAERVIYVYTRSIHYFIDFYFKIGEFKLHF